MRRFFNIFAAASLFHFTMIGADLVCSRHGNSGAIENETHHTTAVDHSAHKGDQTEEKSPCRVPGLPACCQIVAPCAVSLSSASETTVPIALADGAVVLAKLVSMPSSRITTPEPPPPKA
jgi:hypothetical protein